MTRQFGMHKQANNTGGQASGKSGSEGKKAVVFSNGHGLIAAQERSKSFMGADTTNLDKGATDLKPKEEKRKFGQRAQQDQTSANDKGPVGVPSFRKNDDRWMARF